MKWSRVGMRNKSGSINDTLKWHARYRPSVVLPTPKRPDGHDDTGQAPQDGRQRVDDRQIGGKDVGHDDAWRTGLAEASPTITSCGRQACRYKRGLASQTGSAMHRTRHVGFEAFSGRVAHAPRALHASC